MVKAQDIRSDGLELPLVEEFFSIQEKGIIRARRPGLSGSEVVMLAVTGVIPVFHGIPWCIRW